MKVPRRVPGGSFARAGPRRYVEVEEIVESAGPAAGHLRLGRAGEGRRIQSSRKPLASTNAPQSVRCGSAYCRALSSDQP